MRKQKNVVHATAAVVATNEFLRYHEKAYDIIPCSYWSSCEVYKKIYGTRRGNKLLYLEDTASCDTRVSRVHTLTQVRSRARLESTYHSLLLSRKRVCRAAVSAAVVLPPVVFTWTIERRTSSLRLCMGERY